MKGIIYYIYSKFDKYPMAPTSLQSYMLHQPMYSSSKHFASRLQGSLLRIRDTKLLMDFPVNFLTFNPTIRCHATPGTPPCLRPFLAMLTADHMRWHVHPLSLCLISHNRLHRSTDPVVTFHVRAAGAGEHPDEGIGFLVKVGHGRHGYRRGRAAARDALLVTSNQTFGVVRSANGGGMLPKEVCIFGCIFEVGVE